MAEHKKKTEVQGQVSQWKSMESLLKAETEPEQFLIKIEEHLHSVDPVVRYSAFELKVKTLDNWARKDKSEIQSLFYKRLSIGTMIYAILPQAKSGHQKQKELVETCVKISQAMRFFDLATAFESKFLSQKSDKNPNDSLSLKEFELENMGEYMPKLRDLNPDSRVSFPVEPWQQNVLNHIDDKNAVLVSAPTSSGKTFMSFYCIKSVLKDVNDPDGVVIFVCPTKALVNQVSATIHQAFGPEMYWFQFTIFNLISPNEFFIGELSHIFSCP